MPRTFTTITAGTLANKPEVLMALLERNFQTSEKGDGTFIEGMMFPQELREFGIVLPRGGAIVPDTTPQELRDTVIKAIDIRFEQTAKALEIGLERLFGVPLPITMRKYNEGSYCTIYLNCDPEYSLYFYWEDELHEALKTCFFKGSVDPMKEVHNFDLHKARIKEEGERLAVQRAVKKALEMERRRQEHNEQEAFLADPSRSLKITMFISNTKSQVAMDMTGTPVQLLRHVFENAWIWGEKRDVYKRGFRFQLNGIGRKEDWIFYASVDDLCTALKSRWSLAYERAEQQQ